MLQNRSFSGSHIKNVARQKESQREVSLFFVFSVSFRQTHGRSDPFFFFNLTA